MVATFTKISRLKKSFKQLTKNIYNIIFRMDLTQVRWQLVRATEHSQSLEQENFELRKQITKLKNDEVVNQSQRIKGLKVFAMGFSGWLQRMKDENNLLKSKFNFEIHSILKDYQLLKQASLKFSQVILEESQKQSKLKDDNLILEERIKQLNIDLMRFDYEKMKALDNLEGIQKILNKLLRQI